MFNTVYRLKKRHWVPVEKIRSKLRTQLLKLLVIWNPACVSVRDSKLINEDNTASNRWLLGYALCKNITWNISSPSSGKSPGCRCLQPLPDFQKLGTMLNSDVSSHFQHPCTPKLKLETFHHWQGKFRSLSKGLRKCRMMWGQLP